MAIIKAIGQSGNCTDAINYVSKEDALITGIDCSSEKSQAIKDFDITKRLYCKTGGRQYKHIIQSFHKNEQVTPGQVHEIGIKLANEQFKGYQVYVATHTDTKSIHNHFIVNSVSLETGYKFQQSRKDLKELKDYSDNLCKEYNLSITEKGKRFDKTSNKNDVITYNIDKYKMFEKAAVGNYKSFIMDLSIKAYKVKSVATSKDDFIKKLQENGIKVIWKDTRKYITFENENGKKVRNKKLTNPNEFSKEALENEFRRNCEKTRRSDEHPRRKKKRIESKGVGKSNIKNNSSYTERRSIKNQLEFYKRRIAENSKGSNKSEERTINKEELER